MKKINKTVLLIIDGLGHSSNVEGNAVAKADMRNLNDAQANFPSALIKASGFEVGLASDKDAGNSEVGHNAIGSGQYIKQGLALLNERIESGALFETDTWHELAENAKKSKLNIIFLLSDGRTHSSFDHLVAVLARCAREDVEVAIHAMSDGRDVAPHSVIDYINRTEAEIARLGVKATIATLGGRGKIFMDRYESDTSIVTRGFELSVMGNADATKDVRAFIRAQYEQNPKMTDETLEPVVLDSRKLIKNGDSVLYLNYRGDRAIELSNMFESGKYLTDEQFAKIDKCVYAGVLQYDADLCLPKKYLCSPPVIENTLEEWLVAHKVRTFAVTETVKYGHLTYFFDGNRPRALEPSLDKRVCFESDKLNNMYNSAPKMQMEKICDMTVREINGGNADFIKVNLPAPDMVGHTGDFDATVVACKTVDKCVGEIIDACRNSNTNLIITADHGNAEVMLHANGTPHTSHTNNLVPFVVLPFAFEGARPFKVADGKHGLTNIAGTVCLLLGIEPSPHFNPPIIEKVD